jgi:hypothetical protein
MKLRIVHDAQGNVIAAAQLDDTKPGKTGFRAKSGQSVADLDVPAELASLQAPDIVKQVRVDVSSAQPRLVRHT